MNNCLAILLASLLGFSGVNTLKKQIIEIQHHLLQQKKLRTLSDPKELATVFKTLRKNPLFNMNDAGAHCYHRSQLIGSYLEKKGIYSEQLYINCPQEDIAVVDPDSGTYHQYGDHWANVVTVNNKKYVIDSQFLKKPMALEQYVRKIVVPTTKVYSEARTQNPKKECSYRLVDRRSYQETRRAIEDKNAKLEEELGLVGPYGNSISLPKEKERKLRARLAPPLKWFDPRISWNTKALKKIKNEIMAWNKKIEKSGLYKRQIAQFIANGSNIKKAYREGRLIKLQQSLKEAEIYRMNTEKIVKQAASWNADPIKVKAQREKIYNGWASKVKLEIEMLRKNWK